MNNEKYLIKTALDLVKKNIGGFRFSNNKPTYLHSIRVYKYLKKHNADLEVQLAGLLHDIVEDSDITLSDLKKIGFNKNIINLVNLCTHDKKIEDIDLQWEYLVKKLIKAKNKDARMIKIADIRDNIMEPYKLHILGFWEKIILKKCSVFIYYGNKYLKNESVYLNFLNTYFNQIKKLYFISKC